MTRVTQEKMDPATRVAQAARGSLAGPQADLDS